MLLTSVAYKEFIEGSHNSTLEDTGGQYGLAAPGQVANLEGHIGVALMVNATLPFLEVLQMTVFFHNFPSCPRRMASICCFCLKTLRLFCKSLEAFNLSRIGVDLSGIP